METRHEKNVQHKLRVKERKDAIAKSLRSQPLRPINACGLQALQRALGLPLDSCLFLKEEVQEGSFKPGRLDEGAGSRARQPNPPVPLTTSTASAMSEPIVPTPGNFDSQEPELLDVIFIAIDFEYSHYSPKTGNIRLRETSLFSFSTAYFDPQDESPKPVRDLILVGHGLGFEIIVLKGLGLDLNLAPSVIEIFDTELLGYEGFGKNFKCSLSNAVRKTGISGGFFHNAGNDANFSPRAMLLLACHRYDALKANSTSQSGLEMYKNLAKF
ncbi:hypothetical protein IFR05_002669 [Cadophora sp. M221]|nr:hypothetical protein IFR05_002669 [Cadophora sp. M221]